jgi:hypothetical protein
MASRAHVIHDYSLAPPHARTRRQVWYRNDRDRSDPIVVPRSSLWRAGGGLITTALAMGAIVTGSAYAAFHTEPPALSQTPAAPLIDTWQLDPLLQQANITNLLAGPARAVPSLALPDNSARLDEEPIFSPPALSGAPQLGPAELSPEPSHDESLPGTRTLPYPGPATAPALPYPNPTTTPPDVVAPTDTAPQTPTPKLDPENPYRD